MICIKLSDFSRYIQHFAHDTIFLYLTNSIKKCNRVVNTDLKKLVNWLDANKISR